MESSKNKSLLFVVNQCEFFLSHRLAIALEAQASGFKVSLACPTSSECQKLAAYNINYFPLDLSPWGQNPIKELKSIYELYNLYKDLSPTIVHHVTIKPVIYGSLAARLARIPAVVNAISGLGQVFTKKGLLAKLRRNLVVQLYRLAFSHPNLRAIFQNQENAALFRELKICDADKIRLVPGAGVDTELYQPTPEISGSPVVLFASRLLLEKGVRFFYQAAKQLLAEAVQARFVIAGPLVHNHPDALAPQELARWQAEKIIEYWGTSQDMPTVFKQAHIFCLPTTYGEGIPKVLLEAASCGKPIVTTNWPGCNAVVKHMHNGLLVETAELSNLNQYLKTLITDEKLRLSFGQKSRELILNQGLDQKSIARQTVGIYRELVGKRM